MRERERDRDRDRERDREREWSVSVSACVCHRVRARVRFKPFERSIGHKYIYSLTRSNFKRTSHLQRKTNKQTKPINRHYPHNLTPPPPTPPKLPDTKHIKSLHGPPYTCIHIKVPVKSPVWLTFTTRPGRCDHEADAPSKERG